MRFTKKMVLGIALLLGLLSSYSLVWAQSDSEEPNAVISFFWREGCSHCAAEKPFLEALTKNPQIDVKAYEVYYSSANREYLFALGEAMGFETNGVPVTVIGDQVWIGFSEDKVAEMEDAIAVCLETGCADPAEMAGIDASGTVTSMSTGEESEPVEEPGSSFPVWIIVAVVIVIASYFLGVYLRTHKKKTTRKRH
jgi:glutaredoxin